MEEQIYKIIRIDEDDFGCEGRPEGQEPMVRVVLEADTGETMIVMMEDALMYTRKLDVGGLAIVGADGLLYAPGAVMSMEEVLEVPVDFESAAVKAAGMNRLKIICTVYALCGIMDVMVGSLRGLGYSVMPTIVSLIGACGLRLLWIFTFFRIYEQFHTPQSLYLTYPVSWIITICAHVVCFVIVRRRISRRLKTQSMAQ